MVLTLSWNNADDTQEIKIGRIENKILTWKPTKATILARVYYRQNRFLGT